MIPDTAAIMAAAQKFETILARDPEAYSFAPLAEIYRGLGRIDDALATARRGCARHPDFAAGQMALARAALAASRKQEAQVALKTVVRVTPENLEAQRLLAEIYLASGERAEAEQCLAIADSLDPEQPLASLYEMPAVEEEAAVEEILDADVLELTEDLVEEFGEMSTADQFAALPDRPSLGDAVRAVPFMIDTPPPIYKEESRAVESAASGESSAAPVLSATIAELYVSQGFPDKGVSVYRQLLAAEPDNVAYQQRLNELAAPTGAARAEGLNDILETLSGWLGNIGRARECRTGNL